MNRALDELADSSQREQQKLVDCIDKIHSLLDAERNATSPAVPKGAQRLAEATVPSLQDFDGFRPIR